MKIEKDIPILLLHKYGNYFLKALISKSRPEHRILILRAMQGVFLDASFSVYGIHPIQVLITSQLTSSEEDIIRHLLKGKLLKLSLVHC